MTYCMIGGRNMHISITVNWRTDREKQLVTKRRKTEKGGWGGSTVKLESRQIHRRVVTTNLRLWDTLKLYTKSPNEFTLTHKSVCRMLPKVHWVVYKGLLDLQVSKDYYSLVWKVGATDRWQSYTIVWTDRKGCGTDQSDNQTNSENICGKSHLHKIKMSQISLYIRLPHALSRKEGLIGWATFD